MLSEWSSIPGVGLPQGPDAARLLANLYLVPVDEAMSDGPWLYSRYMDDIRVLAATKGEAVRAVHKLEVECRRRGLVLSAAKTKLMHGEQARIELGDSELDAVQYLFESHRASSAQEFRRILNTAISEEGNLDGRRARFSLWRLQELRNRDVLPAVLGSSSYSLQSRQSWPHT